MAILLKGLILPIGGASAVEGLLSTGRTPSSLDEPSLNWSTERNMSVFHHI